MRHTAIAAAAALVAVSPTAAADYAYDFSDYAIGQVLESPLILPGVTIEAGLVFAVDGGGKSLFAFPAQSSYRLTFDSPATNISFQTSADFFADPEGIQVSYIVGGVAFPGGVSPIDGNSGTIEFHDFSFLPPVDILVIDFGSVGFGIGFDDLRFTLDGDVTPPPPPPGGIPEPGTWAMLIAGFGLVGAAARRRRPISA